MTDMYADHGPVLVKHAAGHCPAVLKWTHSIVYEPTFKSEWQAREDARGLALEVAEGSLMSFYD